MTGPFVVFWVCLCGVLGFLFGFLFVLFFVFEGRCP